MLPEPGILRIKIKIDGSHKNINDSLATTAGGSIQRNCDWVKESFCIDTVAAFPTENFKLENSTYIHAKFGWGRMMTIPGPLAKEKDPVKLTITRQLRHVNPIMVLLTPRIKYVE